MTRSARKKLTSSQEDYLEAILLLVRRGQVARVRDIARRLKVGMPSVTAALKSLSKLGLVNYDPYQLVTLTDLGRQVAEGVARRHDLLRKFFIDVLGLDAEVAEANACRVEHAVDAPLLDRLTRFVEFVASGPPAGADWAKAFRASCVRTAAGAAAHPRRGRRTMEQGKAKRHA